MGKSEKQFKGSLPDLEEAARKLQVVLQRCVDAIEKETQKKEFAEAAEATTSFITQLILLTGGDEAPLPDQTASSLSKRMKTILALAQTVFGDRESRV